MSLLLERRENMYWEKYNTKAWNPNDGEDFNGTKAEILKLLKEQKVSLTKIRFLFDSIITEIEEQNPINL